MCPCRTDRARKSPALATTNQTAFQTSIVGTTIDLSTYTEDVSLEDANNDGRIDDLDRFPSATDTAAFDPPPGEGITIGGTFSQVQTFATFNATFVTKDGQSLSPIRVVAYQLTNGTVAFRLDVAGFGDIAAAGGVFRNDLQSITINSFNSYFRSAGNAGHSLPFAPCYTAGTMILTDRGEVRVEDLRIGDMVGTPEHGFQAVRWVGRRQLKFTADGRLDHMRPVRISGAAFGGEGNCRDLTVSPQHRILMRSRLTQRLFGSQEVLVPAIALVESGVARVVSEAAAVTYIHFMCASHQIVRAEGVLSESLYLGRQARLSLGERSLAEIFELFPDLRDDALPAVAAQLVSRRRAQRLIARHQVNNIPMIEARA